MQTLVLGGAGYIGSHVVLELLDRGEEVVVIDNLSTGFRCAIPKGVPLIVGNAGDRALVEQVIRGQRVSAIIHLAGSIVVPESIVNPLAYYENNTTVSRALIESAVTCGVQHFIFSSSAAVYGAPESVPVFEDARLAPLSPYGSSKLMVEMMLRDSAAAYGLRHVTLRYFNVAGADPKRRSGQSGTNATHLIKVACQAATGQRPHVEVFGADYPTPDGSCIRDYIHVTDLARVHVSALDSLRAGQKSQVLNCGYGQGYSVLEVIEAVERVYGGKLFVRVGPRRAGDPPILVAGSKRIREVLGWKPERDSLTQIVEDALRWERHLEGATQRGYECDHFG